MRDAGGTLIYVLVTGTSTRRADEIRALFPDVTLLSLGELVGPTLLTELSRSLTRARVQQYQRYFADADRVLILLHNDPDPDAMASGLALRNLLRRTKTTAIIGAAAGDDPSREPADGQPARHPGRDRSRPSSSPGSTASRPWTSSPTTFSGLLDRVDLVIDHHPEQPGYSAVFKDIRADYGSTCTILTEHLRAVDVNISERTATAMLYAIKSDTLFFARQTNPVDLEAFSFLYPLANAALIRKMEGAEITLERLGFVKEAFANGSLADQVYCAWLGPSPREDFIPYVADFFLQLEDVKWTIIGGQVNGLGHRLGPQPRLHAERRRVRQAMVRRHRQRGRSPRDGQGRGARRAFIEKFGPLEPGIVHAKLREMAATFLKESPDRQGPEERTSPGLAARGAWRRQAAADDLRRRSGVQSARACREMSRDQVGGSPPSPTESRNMPRVTPARASCSSV